MIDIQRYQRLTKNQVSADGFGKDIWTITPPNIEHVVKVCRLENTLSCANIVLISVQLTWLTEIFYFVAVGLTKITVLLFYLRVFPQSGLRAICITTICVAIAYTLSFTFAAIFHCWPMEVSNIFYSNFTVCSVLKLASNHLI